MITLAKDALAVLTDEPISVLRDIVSAHRDAGISGERLSLKAIHPPKGQLNGFFFIRKAAQARSVDRRWSYGGSCSLDAFSSRC